MKKFQLQLQGGGSHPQQSLSKSPGDAIIQGLRLALPRSCDQARPPGSTFRLRRLQPESGASGRHGLASLMVTNRPSSRRHTAFLKRPETLGCFSDLDHRRWVARSSVSVAQRRSDTVRAGNVAGNPTRVAEAATRSQIGSIHHGAGVSH